MKRPDPFIISLLFVIAGSYATSYFGGDTREWHLGEIGKAGIAGIFFFYGLKLDTHQLKNDLTNWKLHIATQLSTFVIFPITAIVFLPFANTPELKTLWFSIFFLATLPSTVSSSVVMVSIAKGNIPSAIFNASISGLIGVFATPFLLSIYMAQGESAVSFADTFAGVAIQILLPVFIGQLLRPWWGNWATKQKSKISTFDKTIILLIVFKSFSSSFASGILQNFGTLKLLGIGFFAVLLFGGVFSALKFISNKLNFSHRDQTVLLFCGSKKSLIHGSVFLSLLFPDSEISGVILLPTMVYHAFQLIAVSFIAQRRSNMQKWHSHKKQV